VQGSNETVQLDSDYDGDNLECDEGSLNVLLETMKTMDGRMRT